MLGIQCNSCGARYRVDVENDPWEEADTPDNGYYCLFCSSFVDNSENTYEEEGV